MLDSITKMNIREKCITLSDFLVHRTLYVTSNVLTSSISRQQVERANIDRTMILYSVF